MGWMIRALMLGASDVEVQQLSLVWNARIMLGETQVRTLPHLPNANQSTPLHKGGLVAWILPLRVRQRQLILSSDLYDNDIVYDNYTDQGHAGKIDVPFWL